MPATRILWGAILVVFAIVLATTWGATQWTAWRLAFQAELGPAWFRLGSLPVYPPPALFWWWHRFDAYAPQVFIEGAGIAASGGFASIVAAIAMSVARAREAKSVVTYGSARWATPPGPGPGGSSRQRWKRPGSAIVHDIKGENFTLPPDLIRGAGWRARFSRVLLFDPTNPQSAAYNPLLEVRRGPAEAPAVRKGRRHSRRSRGRAGAQKRRPAARCSSARSCTCPMLKADKTLAGVANFLSDPRRPIETTVQMMTTTRASQIEKAYGLKQRHSRQSPWRKNFATNDERTGKLFSRSAPRPSCAR